MCIRDRNQEPTRFFSVVLTFLYQVRHVHLQPEAVFIQALNQEPSRSSPLSLTFLCQVPHVGLQPKAILGGRLEGQAGGHLCFQVADGGDVLHVTAGLEHMAGLLRGPANKPHVLLRHEWWLTGTASLVRWSQHPQCQLFLSPALMHTGGICLLFSIYVFPMHAAVNVIRMVNRLYKLLITNCPVQSTGS